MHSKEFEEEYEILKSIYAEIQMGEEKTANNESVVSIVLYPSTCDDDETRYVTLCLEFNIPSSYPSQPPKILFKSPRGLSEAKLTDLHAKLMKKCLEDLLDTPMLFQIIDSVQEFLTTNNLPASDCPICLNSFHPADVFYRSKCFHYFHSQCLGKFLQNIIKNNNSVEETTINAPSDSKIMVPQFLCPVCREELDQSTIDIEKFLDSPAPFGEAEEAELYADDEAGAIGSLAKVAPEWLEHREHMKTLYEKQEKQGGIIDLNQQLGKLLIISTPAPVNDETESPESTESTESPDSGTGTASSTIKISPSSSDSSQTPSNSSGRPTKPHQAPKVSASSGSSGKGHHHYQYRSHSNFRHVNRQPQGNIGPRKSHDSRSHGGDGPLATSLTKESVPVKPANDSVLAKSKHTEPNVAKQPEPCHQSKSTNNGNAKPNQSADSVHNTGLRLDQRHASGTGKGHEAEAKRNEEKAQQEERRSKLGEGAAVLANGEKKTENTHTEDRDANSQPQPHGRIRNFRHQTHPRGNHNYNNHHNRGYGGARKYDQARQNYAEDQ